MQKQLAQFFDSRLKMALPARQFPSYHQQSCIKALLQRDQQIRTRDVETSVSFILDIAPLVKFMILSENVRR
uniref:Uncharacterized protein n=1 Tax=Romanomermis culicivorax TaxID=13658 RepID=A0A915J240_ROMCU